jgi:hypothetical protein
MNSKLQSLVDKFVTTPIYLTNGAGFLAQKFKASQSDIYKAKERAREILHNQETTTLNNVISEQEEYISKNINEVKGECDINGKIKKRITSLQDLIDFCKIDTTQWKIVSWECNKWEVGRKDKSVNWKAKHGVGKGKVNDSGKIFVEPLFQVKAKLTRISTDEIFQKEFEKFLKTYKPVPAVFRPLMLPIKREEAMLVLPKQDAHFNRADFNGNNNIHARFEIVKQETINILLEASALHKLDKITYIVGSDQFNSEWTSATTAGTPQENILSYQEAFKLVCDHEVSIIENLVANCANVEILFVPGNHDEHVGWHLINWLKCYYRSNKYITITEGNPESPRRYERYGNSAVMYDHGALLNGKDLAQRFPIEFKREWSLCDNYYIFSGDKHHELSLDVHGVKYYRVPALTMTKSKWEHKKGYVTKGEMQAFLIKKDKGLTNMYSRLLE